MKNNLAWKILSDHLVDGVLEKGREIGIRIDQTLNTDTTGTMVCLEFETLDIPKTKTELSVSYVDHNTLQVGYQNADDHLFLRTFAEKHGIVFSKPGNGVCHQVHLHRFSKPGRTLMGADSHTPNSSAIGMIAMGAGGLDITMAMAGSPFYLKTPGVIRIWLEGSLRSGVSAKDVILEVLRRISVKGGVGNILEYAGPGVATLSIPERGTITNMGAETGATSSIFPSDEVTRRFLRAQGREEDWVPLAADEGASYDDEIRINLGSLEPLVAQPHMPDRVVPAAKLGGVALDQVFIGSCTNSSYADMAKAASILEGKSVPPSVSLIVAPGSRQVFEMMARDGILAKLIGAGARVLECACGPCVGVGQSPVTEGVSLRTSNRNFPGRSGTADARVYLCSPETAAASALKGYITDPRTLGEIIEVKDPENYILDTNLIVLPPENPSGVKVIKGPNIKSIPLRGELPDAFEKEVLLKLDNNITTDDISPAGAMYLPMRSNVPLISNYVFFGIDPTFAERAREKDGGILVAGENYGQGSAREHAALCPMFLGIRAVLAKSFARIHHNNLINWGILPLWFNDPADYDRIESDDTFLFSDVREAVRQGTMEVTLKRTGEALKAHLELTQLQKEILLDGGRLLREKKRLKEPMTEECGVTPVRLP